MNQSQADNIFVTYQFVNGNNEGSIYSNKEFHLCYCIIDVNLKSNTKKVIGCFVNPNDMYLSKTNDIESIIFYFQIHPKLDEIVNIQRILKNTIRSKNYSNIIIKKSLFENKDPQVIKMITKCLTVLKDKVLI